MRTHCPANSVCPVQAPNFSAKLRIPDYAERKHGRFGHAASKPLHNLFESIGLASIAAEWSSLLVVDGDDGDGEVPLEPTILKLKGALGKEQVFMFNPPVSRSPPLPRPVQPLAPFLAQRAPSPN